MMGRGRRIAGWGFRRAREGTPHCAGLLRRRFAREARAGPWSKGRLRPMIWAAAAIGMLRRVRDAEVRRKLSLFVRSRWFRPPLDGAVMAGLMYDAVTSLGAPARPTASLLPS